MCLKKEKVKAKGNQQVGEKEADPIGIQLVETMCKWGVKSKSSEGQAKNQNQNPPQKTQRSWRVGELSYYPPPRCQWLYFSEPPDIDTISSTSCNCSHFITKDCCSAQESFTVYEHKEISWFIILFYVDNPGQTDQKPNQPSTSMIALQLQVASRRNECYVICVYSCWDCCFLLLGPLIAGSQQHVM